MTKYEYKVVPAPTKGLKTKGAKRPEDRFALALSEVMNSHGAEGWEYVRADILPTEERSGLTSKQTVYHNLLVFRRQRQELAENAAPPEVEIVEEPPLSAALGLQDQPPQEADDPAQDSAPGTEEDTARAPATSSAQT